MQSATLNSRLRVLVAKTYRAEKLYSSIRSNHREMLSRELATRESGALGNSTSLAELANDARAKEWQNCHYTLRVALNELLSEQDAKLQAQEVLRLREEYAHKAQERSALVEHGAQTLAEMAKREEFAHTLKLSIELVRHKARAQACKVISDDLNAVLVQSSRSTDATNLPPKAEPEPMQEVARPDNVVALPYRRAAGGGGRRLR